MTTEPISVSPDDDLQQAVELLIEEKWVESRWGMKQRG